MMVVRMPSEGVDDGSYPGAKQGKAGLFSVECEVCGREYDSREEVAEDHRPGCTIRRALEARGQTAEQLDEERDLRVMTDGGIQTDLHPSRQTALDEAGDDEDDSHSWCPGPAGLEDGELCCWDCFVAASQEQRDAYNEHPNSHAQVKVVDDGE